MTTYQTFPSFIVNIFQYGETALILACKTRNPNFVGKLLNKSANPNICNEVSNKHR